MFPARSPRPPRQLSWALASLSLAMLLSSLGTSITNVALPTLAQVFNASFQQVQWVVLAYLLAITTLVVSAGRLGDLLGRRRLLLAGTSLFTVASVLCGIAPTLELLVAARVLQGLGAATMMALSMALVSETAPPEKTGSALGLLATMSAVGTALGPSLGGVLIATLGWRALFLVNLPLGLLAVGLLVRSLPVRAAPAQRAGFDTLGTLLLALTLAAYALAMTVGRGHFGALNLVLLLAAACGLAGWVHTEARAPSPLVPLGMFRDPVLRTSLATGTLVMTVMMATLVVGPFYLTRGLGLDAVGVGLVMSLGPLAAALTGAPAGRLADRFGTQRLAVVGLLGMVLACLALGLLPATLGVAGYIAPLVTLTIGYALFQTANNTAAMVGVRADQRGVVSGLLTLSRNLGLLTGASVMGAVFAVVAGDLSTAPPEAVAAGWRSTFAVATVLVVAALAIVVAGRPKGREKALS